MAPTARTEFEVDVDGLASGRARVMLRGRLASEAVANCWRTLSGRFGGASVKRLDIDATGLESCDGAGLAFLKYLNLGGMAPGAAVSIHGLNSEIGASLAAFTSAEYDQLRPALGAKKPGVAEEVGFAASEVVADLHEQVEFLGNLSSCLAGTIGDRKRMRWSEVRHIFEQAGANAVPIVSLISVLVGFIIAFESAQPLAQFGARIYVANMIGLVMVRELGPLMTAILLAGRSASAFAAELGTMKVNEELSALETFGLDPIRFLVVQRVTAGILLTPLLTAYSIFMGVLGGVLVMLALGFPLALIRHQLQASVHLNDLALGIGKGVVFGAIMSAVGCLRGLQTKQGPSAVGASTTRAVVTSILLIIIADALFSVLFFSLKTKI